MGEAAAISISQIGSGLRVNLATVQIISLTDMFMYGNMILSSNIDNTSSLPSFIGWLYDWSHWDTPSPLQNRGLLVIL